MIQAAYWLAEEADRYEDCAGVWEPAPLASLSADAREEYRASLLLRHTPGIGARSLAKLLHAFGGANEACEKWRDWPECGINHTRVNAFKNKTGREYARQEWENAAKSDARILLWKSSHYPANLRQLADSPPFLYCRGDLALLSGPCIAVVGTRCPTPNSREVAFSFAQTLSKCGITVVSGLALGIDRNAHAGALRGPGQTIGVLGTGIDIEYPKSNSDIYRQMRDGGLIVSEFSPRTPPAAANFPIRNRIISGLSLGVVVIEAATRSGSLITARLALEQNREVFAVPGGALNPNSLGCQNLVRQGARPVFCAEDIIKDLADLLRPYNIKHPDAEAYIEPAKARDAGEQSGGRKKRIPLKNSVPDSTGRQRAFAERESAPDESFSMPRSFCEGSDLEKALGALSAEGEMDIDRLAELTALSHGDLNGVLLMLEMSGKIKRLPGARFGLA